MGCVGRLGESDCNLSAAATLRRAARWRVIHQTRRGRALRLCIQVGTEPVGTVGSPALLEMASTSVRRKIKLRAQDFEVRLGDYPAPRPSGPDLRVIALMRPSSRRWLFFRFRLHQP